MITFKQYMKMHDIRGISSGNHETEDEERVLSTGEDNPSEKPTGQFDPNQQQEETDLPSGDEQNDDQDQEQQDDDQGGIDQNEDPDHQGLVRNVKGAHLIFKRKSEEGKFEELWIYHINEKGLRTEYQVRSDILAGTDIPINQSESDDGAQQAELWTAGDAQLLYITGLPN